MPKTLQHLMNSAFVAVVICAGAAAADTGSMSVPAANPSMSEEMLRIWQMRDAVDSSPQSVSEFDGAGEFGEDPFDAAPRQVWQLDAPADDAPVSTTGITTSSGQSLTPNLDRLMQRSHQPLVRSDAPGVTSTAAPAAWGEPAYSKSGAATLDGRNRNRRGGNRGGGHHDGGGQGGGHRDGGGQGGGHHGGGGGGGCEPPTPTPEPTTLLLFGSAAAAAAGVRKRRQRN